MTVALILHYGDTLENLDWWGPLDTLPYSLDDPKWPTVAAVEMKGGSVSPGKGILILRRGVPLSALSHSGSFGKLAIHMGRWPGITTAPSFGKGSLNGRLKGYDWTPVTLPSSLPWQSRQV